MQRASSAGAGGGSPAAAPEGELARGAKMGASLAWYLASWGAASTLRFLGGLPAAAGRSLWLRRGAGAEGGLMRRTDAGVDFYEGDVWHCRRAPVCNSFTYGLRTAVISLDSPPAWFRASGQAAAHLSAQSARELCRAPPGYRVLLQATPLSYGFGENPLCVYFVVPPEDEGGEAALPPTAPLLRIAEVTNNPWKERVRFVFDGRGDRVRKCLHVSPLMDMEATWTLTAPTVGETLSVTVELDHPTLGAKFFTATLRARRCAGPARHLRSEELPLGGYIAWACAPQRVFARIYWQAVKLLAKGLPFLGNPPIADYALDFKRRAEAGDADVSGPASVCPAIGGGGDAAAPPSVCPRAFVWNAAETYPWHRREEKNLVVTANTTVALTPNRSRAPELAAPSA